jgi:hypothetical protein
VALKKQGLSSQEKKQEKASDDADPCLNWMTWLRFHFSEPGSNLRALVAALSAFQSWWYELTETVV